MRGTGAVGRDGAPGRLDRIQLDGRRLHGPGAPGVVCGGRDGEVLDGQAGRVEERHRAGVRAPRRVAGKHGAEIGDHVAGDDALLDRRRQLAAVAGLRPFVAEQRARDDRRNGRLRLARAVGAEHVQVQARTQIADVDDRLGARRDAADDVTGQRVVPVADRPAELVGHGLRHLGARIGAHARPVPRGGQATRRPRPVQPTAHDPGRARILTRERARGDRRHGAGTQRGHRARVEQRHRRARRRVAEHDDAHHGRQAVRGVAGEGRDPLEHGEAVATGGHGAEVAVARALEVDLRRHRPLARVVAHEGRARALDGLLGRHGGQDGVVGEDRDGAHGVA